MDNVFSCEQALRVALEMERRGRSLYLRAAQVVGDAAFQAMLIDMAREEEEHYAFFAALLDTLGAPAMTMEENALAAATVADFYFPGGLMEASLEGALSSRDAMLAHSMRAERDSIAFYERIQATLPPDAAVAIGRIIREEQGHLRALAARREEVSGSPDA